MTALCECDVPSPKEDKPETDCIICGKEIPKCSFCGERIEKRGGCRCDFR